jgi:hypothetical protein
VRRRDERERRVVELRFLVQAGLFTVDVDRLALVLVQHSRKKARVRLDGARSC